MAKSKKHQSAKDCPWVLAIRDGTPEFQILGGVSYELVKKVKKIVNLEIGIALSCNFFLQYNNTIILIMQNRCAMPI